MNENSRHELIKNKLVDLIGDSVFVARMEDGKFVEVNDMACVSMGYTRDEFQKLTVYDICNDINSEEECKNLLDEIQRTGSVKFSGEHLKKDGSTFPVEVNITSTFRDGEKFIVGVARNITHTKALEKELREESHKLKSALDVMGAGISLRDRDYNITYQAGISDIHFPDSVGKKCYRAYKGLDAICEDCPVEKTFKDGEKHVLTSRVLMDDGREVFIQNTSSPVYDDNGNIAACMEIVNDITEQKNIEKILIDNHEKLGNEREQFLALFDGIEDMLYVADIENYKLLYVNDTFERLFGKETIGKLCYEVIQSRSEPCPFCTNHIITGEGLGKSYVWEKQNELNGNWYRCADKAIKWTDEKLVRFEIATDITPMKKAEESALQSEFWMIQSQRVARVGSYVLDVAKGRWTSSEVMDEIFGIDENYEHSVEGWGNIIYSEDREMMMNYFQNEVIGRGLAFDKEYRIQRKNDGEVRWVSGQGELVFENGAPSIMLGCIRDITEQKQAEEASEEMSRQLVQSQKMDAVGHLAGGMAHDFNNLLGVITGCAQLALSEIPDDRTVAKEELNVLLGVVKRAKDITMNLLTFARKGNIELEKVSTAKLIKNLSLILERSLDKNINIEIENEYSELILTIDSNQVVQALLNICINAADAMKGGGTLKIKIEETVPGDENCLTNLRDEGKCCVINITDTGHGIKESELHRVMEPFFTTKEMGKGTGLGLSVCHGIIKNNNGRIKILSKEGEGTTVKVYLPVTGEKPLKKQQKADVKEDVLGGSETILLVDDEELLLSVTSRQLQKKGYNVLTASNGDSAMKTFKDKYQEIDMVVLDYMMPKTNAYKLFMGMKKLKENVNVIIISGFSDEENLKKILTSGASGFVQKPFEIDELCTKIRQSLANV